MSFYEKIKHLIFGSPIKPKKINFVAEGYNENSGKPEHLMDNTTVGSDHDAICASRVEPRIVALPKYNFVAKNYHYASQPLRPMKRFWFDVPEPKRDILDQFDLFNPHNQSRELQDKLIEDFHRDMNNASCDIHDFTYRNDDNF